MIVEALLIVFKLSTEIFKDLKLIETYWLSTKYWKSIYSRYVVGG